VVLDQQHPAAWPDANLVKALAQRDTVLARLLFHKTQGEPAGDIFSGGVFRSVTESGLTLGDFLEVDHHASLSRNEFEALAWDAAMAKARDLGWIA
jgi:hypothetical protein